jgi:ferredoxin
VKIVIRKDLCCGAQLCIQAAPGLYRLDALGYNDSDGDEVPAGQEEKARESAALCPESAIGFEE